jgi:hypothetical protein
VKAGFAFVLLSRRFKDYGLAGRFKFWIANCGLRIWDERVIRRAILLIEVLIFSALIFAARCANYQDVFVSGNVYFTDADCYARMTRVRICQQHPGLIVRHHEFENFPQGTTPHTTSPLDYLILALSILLKPFTAHAIDLAGALISPFLAVLCGWFLWWWSRRMHFNHRWMMLILYAISPILIQGAELGRPDHQSLLMLLVTIAICAEWTLGSGTSTHIASGTSTTTSLQWWSVVSGSAWAFAIWVSAYEPLVLLVIVLLLLLIDIFHPRRIETAAESAAPTGVFIRGRRLGWIVFAAIILIALLIERRIPALSIFQSGEIFRNWSRTIGELAHVSPLDPIWFRWTGWTLIGVIFLIWFSFRNSRVGRNNKVEAAPTLAIVLLAATYLLTIWQARWAYFFTLIVAIALSGLLQPIKSRALVWIAFTLSLFPILRDWDERLWPNESEYARRIETRRESIELRELSLNMMSSETHPFLAPWWLSPRIAYWSGQPGVAGSSHESLNGTAESARFYLAEDFQKARQILNNHKVTWVFGYDAERTAQNSAIILGKPVVEHGLCYVLERAPAQASRFFVLFGQNGTARLFRVADNR